MIASGNPAALTGRRLTFAKPARKVTRSRAHGAARAARDAASRPAARYAGSHRPALSFHDGGGPGSGSISEVRIAASVSAR